MQILKWSRSVGRCLGIWLLMQSPIWQGPELVYGQEVVWKLDLSEVEFVLKNHGPFHEELKARAVEKFADAKLPMQAGYGYPRLQLTLRQRESEHCKGVFLYLNKLELFEEVVIPRSGHKEIVTTWFMGLRKDLETERRSLADLQNDLEHMLRVFIEQYQFVNGLKIFAP